MYLGSVNLSCLTPPRIIGVSVEKLQKKGHRPRAMSFEKGEKIITFYYTTLFDEINPQLLGFFLLKRCSILGIEAWFFIFPPPSPRLSPPNRGASLFKAPRSNLDINQK